MSEISVELLTLASNILLSRLTRPSTLDIGMVKPDLQSGGQKIDSLLGQYSGCLDATARGDLRFYFAARSKPEGEIDHVIVFYLNEDHEQIQPREMDVLMHHLSNIGRSDSSIKLGVINIFTNVVRPAYLSSFLSAINHILGRQLIDNFKPYAKIKLSLGEIAIGPQASCNLSYCDGKPSKQTLERFQALVSEYGATLKLGDANTKLNDPEVVLMRDNGHLLGCFYNKEYHLINFLVMHRNQFLDEQSYDRVKDITRNWYPAGGELTFYVTRFYPNMHRRCDDELVQTAWRLILLMRPHVLVTLQENELHYLAGNIDQMSIWRNAMLNKSANSIMQPRSSSQTSQLSVTPDVDIDLLLSSQKMYPDETLLSDLFHPYDYDELWTNNSSTLEEMSRERRRIRDSIVPPVHELEPYSDLIQGYLTALPSYEDGVKLMAQICSRYVHTYAFSKLRSRVDVNDHDYKGAQFLICPIDREINDDQLVIVDNYRREWIHLDASNRSHKDSTYLDDFIVPFMDLLLPECADYQKRSVYMTSITHMEYPKLHLLMALYVLSRLFHYATVLPKKIIYGEWELRCYAKNIYAELQVVNTMYNVAMGLVDSNGYLLPNAMESLPSPLLLETSVVPKDQCMFCLGRYKRNLGKHMAAAHGKQAEMASHCRLKSH